MFHFYTSSKFSIIQIFHNSNFHCDRIDSMLTFKILSTLIIIFLSIYFFILKIFHTFISFFPGFDNTTAVIGSAEQYYDYSVLKKIDDISGGIGMPDLKLTACLAACYLVLFLTLWKGSSFICFFINWATFSRLTNFLSF